MDEYSSKRAASGLVISRKGPNMVLRDSTDNNRDRNVQVCSRVGCGSRLSPMKSTQFGSPGKAKTPRTPFRSSARGKEITGSSSRNPAAANASRKSFSELRKKLPSRLETDSETRSLQDESEVSESTPTSGEAQMSPEDHEPAGATSVEAGSSSSGPTNRHVKRNTQKFGLGRQDSSSGSSTSFAFKQANQGARNGGSTNRYNLRNLRCKSISDVVQSGSSSPELSVGRRRDVGRKRIGEPESSLSTRGKKINGPTVDDKRDESSNRGISLSDSRRARNLNGDNNVASVRSQRSTSRTRLSNQENSNRSSLVESPLMTGDASSAEPGVSLDATGSRVENQVPARTPSSRVSSFSTPRGSGEHVRPNRANSPYEAGIARSFMNRDTLRQYNLDGIAEMLLALDRIEPEEEPTYEQLLVLETNLFLGGLGFHDQHRDMRLDIDNMSYEELLALEERMGTVSTALPEDALAKCLSRSMYQGTTDCAEDEDDFKCCICQEEYGDGEELGKLGCEHKYHVECIYQWLRMKNWCPICKASAAPPPSPSPP